MKTQSSAARVKSIALHRSGGTFMTKSILVCALGLIIGSAATYAYMTNSGEPLKHPLIVELHRFEMQNGSEKAFRDWIKWHDEAHEPIIKTLEREKMYFEAVFRDPEQKDNAIYWVEVHGAHGNSVNDSPLAVDQVHRNYMNRILVPGSKRTAVAEYLLIPDFIEDAIRHHEGG
jgi:hypothetical protein